nr:restriction endonuclease [Paenibacillus polymyxa]
MEDGKDFEFYLRKLFNCLGYSDAYKIQGSRDFGADLVFTDTCVNC